MLRTEARHASARIAMPAILAVLLLLGACGRTAPGAVVEPAVGVHYSTGDPRDLGNEQVGVAAGDRAAAEIRATGDLDFEGPVHVACGPVPGSAATTFRVRLTAEDAATFDLTLLLPGFEHYGTYEAEARLARIGGDRELRHSFGQGSVEIASAVARAGRHAASGSFTAEVQGAAGGGKIEGTFERCSFFD